MGSASKTQGAAVISQCRVLDWQARQAKRVETVSNEVINEVLAKLDAMTSE
jgi:mRNA interferase ChpB